LRLKSKKEPADEFRATEVGRYRTWLKG